MGSLRSLQSRFVRALAVPAVALFALGAAPADTQPAGVGKTAWYTQHSSDALPPVLFREFPPGLVCLLVPDACNDDAAVVTAPIDAVVRGLDIPPGPVQPVAPGTLPVGLLGGYPRFSSYLQFPAPDVPADREIERFELVLHEDGVNYAMESPAFRGVLRAAIALESDPSPEHFTKLLSSMADGETAVLVPEPTGVEACPVLEAWDEGENLDGREQPERDCIFGANGVRGEDGSWTFDLTYAAQSWVDGTVENHGVYVGPVSPQNVEYGDADPSTNFQISFAGPDAEPALQPAVRLVLRERGAEPTPVPATGSIDPGPGLAAGPAPDFAGGVEVAESGVFEPGDGTPPVSAPGAEVPAEPVSAPVPAKSAPGSLPWPAWLLLPLGLSGAALFARAAEADVGSAPQRSGVLERLTG